MEKTTLVPRMRVDASVMRKKKEAVAEEKKEEEVRNLKKADKKAKAEQRKKEEKQAAEAKNKADEELMKKHNLINITKRRIETNVPYIRRGTLKKETRSHTPFISVLRSLITDPFLVQVMNDTNDNITATAKDPKKRTVFDKTTGRSYKSIRKREATVEAEDVFWFFVNTVGLEALSEVEKKGAKPKNMTMERYRFIRSNITAEMNSVAPIWTKNVLSIVNLPDVLATDDVLFKYVGKLDHAKTVIQAKPAGEGVYNDATCFVLRKSNKPVLAAAMYYTEANKHSNGDGALSLAITLTKENGVDIITVYVSDAGYGTWAMIDRLMMMNPPQAAVVAMSEKKLGKQLAELLKRGLGVNQYRQVLLTRQPEGSDQAYEVMVSVKRVNKDPSKRYQIAVSTAHKLAGEQGGHQASIKPGVSVSLIQEFIKNPLHLNYLLIKMGITVPGGDKNIVGKACALLDVPVEQYLVKMLAEKARKAKEAQQTGIAAPKRKAGRPKKKRDNDDYYHADTAAASAAASKNSQQSGAAAKRARRSASVPARYRKDDEDDDEDEDDDYDDLESMVNGGEDDFLATDDDEDVVCGTCGLRDPPGDDPRTVWGQCEQCDRWHHSVCVSDVENQCVCHHDQEQPGQEANATKLTSDQLGQLKGEELVALTISKNVRQGGKSKGELVERMRRYVPPAEDPVANFLKDKETNEAKVNEFYRSNFKPVDFSDQLKANVGKRWHSIKGGGNVNRVQFWNFMQVAIATAYSIWLESNWTQYGRISEKKTVNAMLTMIWKTEAEWKEEAVGENGADTN